MESAQAGETTDRFISVVTEWVQQLIRMNALVAAELNLVPTDLHCLHVLQHDQPMTTGKLGDQVGLSPGAASRMIDRLELAGLVVRTRDTSDRRKVTVTTTRAGLERAGAAYSGLSERTEQDLRSFSTEELQAIIRFVELSLHSVASEATALAARVTPA